MPTSLATCSTQSSSCRMTSYCGHPGLGHVMPINVDVTYGNDAGTANSLIAANKPGNTGRCSGSVPGLPPWNHVFGIRSTALNRTTVAVYRSTPSTFKTSGTALLHSLTSHRSSMTSMISSVPPTDRLRELAPQQFPSCHFWPSDQFWPLGIYNQLTRAPTHCSTFV